jgi:hypothetical protein
VSSQLAVSVFLERLRRLLAAGRVVFRPASRRKSWEFLLAEGLNEEDVLDTVSRLRPDHYHSGPEGDRNGSGGSVMVFFYPYKKTTLYVKVKIWTSSEGDEGAVLSFHEEGEHD